MMGLMAGDRVGDPSSHGAAGVDSVEFDENITLRRLKFRVQIQRGTNISMY